MLDDATFVSAVHRTGSAARVATWTIMLPQIGFHQFVQLSGVLIHDQVARLAPAQWRVGRIGPRPAGIIPLAAQELQIEWIIVKAEMSFRSQEPVERQVPNSGVPGKYPGLEGKHRENRPKS